MTSGSVVMPPIKKPEQLQPLVAKALAGIEFESASAFDELIVTVAPATIVEVCLKLRSDDDLHLDYLRCLSGVDVEDGIEIVYHLYSVCRRHKLVVKTKVSREVASLASVTGVWKGADWHEREAAEMFGIVFEGHPDLKTLLLEEGFKGHPLLKSFKLDAIPEDVEKAHGKNS
ncbi:MAG: NADH-quinone oxidoreductase subunit C [Dehalococcoidia bacterium]|nr:NADH-quinone oxidoreductase subunit C [Dehalococcoidia bacterium]